MTDANLMLGRLLPQYFPKIFGPNENEALDTDTTKEKFIELTNEINESFRKSGEQREMSLEEVALGFIKVANETMCRPIRALTQARGLETAQHSLVCFGGAGGQHACAIARQLGIKTVLIHKYAGILSAYGMALADVVLEKQKPCGISYKATNESTIKEGLAELQEEVRSGLLQQGYTDIVLESYLHLRYEGTDGAFMCAIPNDPNWFASFQSVFEERYRSEYGFVLQNREIIVDDIRIRGLGKTSTPPELPVEAASSSCLLPKEDEITRVHFETGTLNTRVYLSEKLRWKHCIPGPAIIIDQLSTILVEPDCEAHVTEFGNLRININTIDQSKIDTKLNSIQLSIFSHRFMSIAEQMGRVLQRTSISTNIKERLDFSCALFGPDGCLVSNAPHIPVHLGAMQETVQYQLKVRGNTIRKGDVILSNHPQAGGSHLPDLTVITPVFATK